MKTFTINIHPSLTDVSVTVNNGRKFQEALLKGEFLNVPFSTNEEDAKRIKQFAVKKGNDKATCRGNWYAHCNGYAMDLCVTNAGKNFSINTYRPYGKYGA